MSQGRAWCVAALTVTLIGVGPASADARPRPKPNLVVTAVSSAPAGLTVGSTFSVTDTTKNAGRRTAKASATRYYLSTDPARSLSDRKDSKTNPRSSFTDILLVGAREVPSLAKGASSVAPPGGTEVQVPGGTPAGDYRLLACADDRGVVKEKPETDNCKASEASQPVGAPPSGIGRVDAFSDTVIPLQPALEPVVPQLLRGLACGGGPAPKTLTLPEAISSARQYLTNTAGAGAMADFAASPTYDSATASQEAAGQAVLTNKPGAALAALLRAHELEPGEASHLVNAGGLAAAIGRPNESLAFLNAAMRLDDSDPPPLGISRQAVSLASRGYSELQLGRYGPAQDALTSALAIEPLLTEAQGTLAGVQACRGQNPLPAFKKGRKRTDRDPPVDDTLGEITEMRDIPISNLPETLYGEAAFYRSLTDANEAARTANFDRIRELEMIVPPADALQLTQKRTNELLIEIYEVAQDADLTALEQEYYDSLDAAEDAWAPLFWRPDGQATDLLNFINDAAAACQNSPDPCATLYIRERCIPATRDAYSDFLPAMTAALDAAKDYMPIYSERVSGIAANFSDPNAYELAEREIQLQGEDLYGPLGTKLAFWAATLEFFVDGESAFCVESPEPPGHTPPAPQPVQGPGGCPDELKGMSFNVSLGPVALSGNCEELTLSGAGEGWISGFGEVTLNAREGTMTVFAGAKGEVGLGPLTGDFKSGVYVKVGLDGPRDVGWRVGPSYTVGAGPAQFGGSDTMDMSFVGALGTLGL